jgi:hypothetical protein
MQQPLEFFLGEDNHGAGRNTKGNCLIRKIR